MVGAIIFLLLGATIMLYALHKKGRLKPPYPYQVALPEAAVQVPRGSRTTRSRAMAAAWPAATRTTTRGASSIRSEGLDVDELAAVVDSMREMCAALVAGLKAEGFTDEQARRITTKTLGGEYVPEPQIRVSEMGPMDYEPERERCTIRRKDDTSVRIRPAGMLCDDCADKDTLD